MSFRTIVSQLRKYKRGMIAATALTVLFSASTVAWLSLVAEPQSQIAPVSSTGSGWGQEAIGDLREYAAALSPIASANACGMGASSCFKCHNGTRAAAPKMDVKTGPWHLDHKSVNGSCAGCHKGNQRLIKKELAHEGLIKDSRLKVAETCETCHKSGNTAELNKRYQK
ncbi:MAG: hypothetical protein ACYC2E_11905 [Sulfuricella sp.]